MNAVKFIQFTSRVSLVPKVPKINGNPFVDGPMTCQMSRKKQMIRISSIRKCLEEGEPEAVVRFIEKVPQFLPYVTSALIDDNETIAFNAEWCVRRIACTSNNVLQIVLMHSLGLLLNSPWMHERKRDGDPRAMELSKEMREVYDLIFERRNH